MAYVRSWYFKSWSQMMALKGLHVRILDPVGPVVQISTFYLALTQNGINGEFTSFLSHEAVNFLPLIPVDMAMANPPKGI